MKLRFAAMALAVATPAYAATDSFMVGSTKISFPVPAGYCRAEGNAARVFAILAKADTINVTHLDLLPCAAKTVVGYDHIAVKTPVAIVNTNIARGDLLKEMKPEFDKPEFRANVAANTAKLTDNLTAQTGTKIEFAGNFGPRGLDNDCAYIAGTLVVSGQDGKKEPPQGAAACLSSVGEKFVSVNFYSADPSNASVQRLMARSRAMMLSMIAHKAN